MGLMGCPRTLLKIATIHCVITQKSAVLIYFVVEAWNCTYPVKWLFCHPVLKGLMFFSHFSSYYVNYFNKTTTWEDPRIRYRQLAQPTPQHVQTSVAETVPLQVCTFVWTFLICRFVYNIHNFPWTVIMKMQKFYFSSYNVYFSSFEVMFVDSNIEHNNWKENIYSILSLLSPFHSFRCARDQ